MELTDQQLTIIEAPLDSSIFLSGPAGTGKTTSGADRVRYLLQNGIPGQSLLLFFPQRNLGAVYQDALSSFTSRGLSLPVSATYGGLARRMLALFWPAILDNFPQLQPDRQPTFLTLESSLYFLSRIVEPLLEKDGYFSSVVIQRNRLYSQILDNLNKSAIHAFPHIEIADRLSSAWIGDPDQLIIYQQAQQAANQFRDYCYQNNLLDYSLQIELFTLALDKIPLIKNYLFNQFNYLIYDNCEEDTPVAHNFIKLLIPQLKSNLVIFDQDAGYRNFLGASTESSLKIADFCKENRTFHTCFVSSPALQSFNKLLRAEFDGQPPASSEHEKSLNSAISIEYQPSYPEMTEWVADKIQELLDDGTSPGEIVILAPYLSDSLRFLILKSLSKYAIPAISHRPSRALRDEPSTQSLLTLAALAHPSWEIHPSTFEIALSLYLLIKDLDLTRAYLLSQQAVRNTPSSNVRLSDFEDIPQKCQERISFFSGNLYQELLNWLKGYASKSALPLDHFLTHLFGEVLSRPGYVFHNDLSQGRLVAQVIDSIGKFRLSAGKALGLDILQTGKEYYRMVKTGVLANQYIKSWTDLPDNKVLISPAYTFLLNNKPVDYQFWLDVGSRGWYERIYQPLTNPHVLHMHWPSGKTWSDEDEQKNNLHSLGCLTTGLIRRCRKSIYCTLTETDERGFEQKGMLLLALNRLIANNRHSVSTSERPANG